MKKISAAFIAAFVFPSVFVFAAFAPVARAQTSPPACAITPADFDALAAVENNPDLSAAEELREELALRRQLLSRTIACAASDARALKAKLAAAPATKNTAGVASLLAGKIDEVANFYDIESAKLNDAGIRATQVIAQELLDARAANYAPLEDQVKNFILFSESQKFFETAENRFAKTDRVVNLIETATENGDLRNALNAVRSPLADAEIENAAALGALKALLPPDQSLALIESSLQSLALAYQKFGALNDLIQKFLPTR